MKIYDFPIAENKINQLHEILKSTGGYWLSNPRVAPDAYGYWRCDICLPTKDARLKWDECRRFFEPEIIEKYSNQWWVCFVRGLITKLKSKK
jgi:hypothetical protein